MGNFSEMIEGRAKALVVLFLLCCLSGCATSRTKGELMVSDPLPITKIWVLNGLGSLPVQTAGPETAVYWSGPFRRAMGTRFVDVLNANGVGVTHSLFLNRSPGSIKEMETLWNSLPAKQAGVSHVLVLSAQSMRLSSRQGNSVQTEAALWEPSTGRVIWQGHPEIYPGELNRPLNDSELLAGKLLVSWKSAALIDASGPAKNLQGKEIKALMPWEKDK